MLAPEKFNLAGQIGDFMALVGTTFIVNAVLSVMMYLKQSPLPPSENGTSRRSI